MQDINCDLCILGAGSGGLSVAAGATQMGVDVVLVEPHKMGGDCLNYGCVPSKALISAARRAYDMQHSDDLGIHADNIQVNFKQVHKHIQSVIAAIAPHDSAERFEGLGARVIKESPHFTDAHTIETQNYRITAKKFVIATGSSARIPNIDGLDKTPYLTNETIFDLEELPQHLLIVGGGPIGCELGQAFAMLGSDVSIFQHHNILAKEDEDTRELIRQDLLKCGVNLYEHTEIQSVSSNSNHVTVHYQQNNASNKITGSHLLVAIGRQPNTDNINLDAALVQYGGHGIQVDRRLRTSQKHIYAIGDVIGEYQFTHAAGYHAGIVIRNALFRLPAKVDYRAMPWVTYTRLELAHVGLNETQAQQQSVPYTKTTFDMKDVDRAQAEGSTEGFIKVLTDNKGRLLGATIIAEGAGELITPWIIAIQQKMKIKAMTEYIAPYPTISDVHKRLSGKYFLPAISSKTTKKLVNFLF